MEMIVADQCSIVGGRVNANACRVTDLSECSCSFGMNGKTKEVFGTVVSVKHSLMATNCKNIVIVADDDFGNNIVKRALWNIRSVASTSLCVATEIKIETAPTDACTAAVKMVTTTATNAPNTNPTIALPTQDHFTPPPATLQVSNRDVAKSKPSRQQASDTYLPWKDLV